MQYRHNITVAEFVEKHFRPERLAKLSPKMVHKYEGAVRRLREVLGQHPTLADLSDQNITRVSAWVLKFGRSRDRAKCYWKCLRSIAKHAQKLGWETGQIDNYQHKRLVFEASDVPSEAPSYQGKGMRYRTKEKIAMAAIQCAMGKSFEAVAEKLNVSINTIYRWQREHRDVWEFAFAEGRRQTAFSVFGFASLIR